MNRGGQVAHPDTHEPLLTTDPEGPAYKTLEDWKRIWNDGLVSEEVLTYNESSYIDAYASGRYVFSPQQLYDLETFNREDRSQIAGHASRLCCKPDVGVSQIRTTTVLSSCFCVGQTVL